MKKKKEGEKGREKGGGEEESIAITAIIQLGFLDGTAMM
jgi:hypothetical protein